MSPEVERVFLAVAEMPLAARAAYYDAQAVPPAVRAEVDSLLVFDTGASQFIAQGLLCSVHRDLYEADMAARYGPYRIVKLIGSGGMGTVYMAERADGEVTQRVAIKLVRIGASGPDRIARFLRERQILATLQHPNIARLTDAGHRDDGVPYLVMDYVDGVPIDEYAAVLTLRQKIELVLEICSAVSYAHRSLVIHRDLKPSNILVDKVGRPHLLDFGIAKILDEAAPGPTTVQRMLTPDYSSPEQVCDRPVTTATDVYSLGGVLYKLLTGLGPHHFEGSTPEGLLAAIQSREPSRPSRIKPELRGDLDLILAKALRKDPEERYHTVDEFAGDLRAYLESRPISARPGEWTYRCSKLLRRHWIPALAAAVAVSALIVGVLVANRQRAVAERRFGEVRQLSARLFDIDEEVRQLPGSTKARQLIVETSLGYLRRLANEVHGDPVLALDLASAYIKVARVQGVSSGRNLGQTEIADQDLRIAQEMLAGVLAKQPSNRTAIALAAEASHDRMILAGQAGGRRDGARRGDALALARQTAAWLDRYKPGPSDPDASGALSLYRNVADQLLQNRQSEEALRICTQGIRLAEAINLGVDAGMFHWVEAEVYQQRGDLEEARKAIDESVRLVESKASVAEPGQIISLAHVLIWQGRIEGGDRGISLGLGEVGAKSFERAFQIVDPMVHADPNDQSNRVRLAMAGTGLAGVRRHSDPALALEVYEHTLRHLEEVPDNAAVQRMQVETLAGMAGPLRQLGRNAEGTRRLDRAFEILSRLKLYPSSKVVPGSVAFKAIRARADDAGAAGDPAAALKVYRGLVAAMQAGGMDAASILEDAVDLSNVWLAMSELHRRNGEPEAAASVSAQRTGLWNEWARRLPGTAFVRRQLAGPWR